ncbi:unnamed protein product [Schistosoma margrebowiei]|uniref:Uncharacterized protein n=1 Tax=Schistosoma margrebowiei TaxID=48269 RepID=A0A183LYD0_9TREM|nr:unnamed protein product [Schistosoma margrebowiei]
MESSRPKEERKTKEHITPGNGDRHEKNEQELDGTRKEGTGQSGLENAGQRPMLLRDNQYHPYPIEFTTQKEYGIQLDHSEDSESNFTNP